MKTENQQPSKEMTGRKQLRLWPGIVLAILQWCLWFVIPKFMAGGQAIAISVFGGMASGLGIIIWWAFFSRAPRSDRWIAVLLMIVALAIIPGFTHASIETGLAGLMYYVYAVPVMCISFVIWAVVSRYFSKGLRRVTMILTIILSCGIWILMRSEGITGNASAQLVWRWAETNQDKFLDPSNDELFSLNASEESDINWSGFRGPNRDGIVRGVKIETDWDISPPEEMWRQSIGSGCSSFAVSGSRVYTQEQRGNDEVVSCYEINSGKPVWWHKYAAYFWDSHAGAGPRSTPTLHDSLVYTLGATGILHALNAFDGSVVWSRNAATDVKLELPGWGIASSPLVVDSIVLVAISGNIVAYDIASGDPLWFGPKGGENYSSPHLTTIDGVQQVIMMSEVATTSFSPADGKILWERKWAGAIVQPGIIGNGDLLLSEGYKKGIHRLTISSESGNWDIKEKWKTNKIRPDFNDFVVHRGHLYGFEGLSITCINLEDGTRKWKSGRFGGQLLLLKDQDLLLVLSEKGELALVDAKADKFNELARFPAIEGKTWNHPVLVDDVLLVRNTKEMAAFRLSLKNS